MKYPIALSVAALLACSPVSADNKFYAGLGIGASNIKRDRPTESYTAVLTTGVVVDANDPAIIVPPTIDEPVTVELDTDLSEADIAFKAFVGWRPLDFLGIEAGWTDLGNPTGSSPAGNPDLNINTYPPPPPAGTVIPPELPVNIVDPDSRYDHEVDIDGWFVSAIAFLPFAEQWELFGKAGVLFWQANYKIQNRVAVLGSPTNVQDPNLLPAVLENDDGSGEDLLLGVGINFNPTSEVTLRGEIEYYDVFDEIVVFNFSAIYNFQ